MNDPFVPGETGLSCTCRRSPAAPRSNDSTIPGVIVYQLNPMVPILGVYQSALHHRGRGADAAMRDHTLTLFGTATEETPCA